MAVGFNNKEAAEVLLHLGANPHIADCYGQRPIDICQLDALRSLLEVKAAVTAQLTAIDPNAPVPKGNHSARSSQFALYTVPTKINRSQMTNTSTKEEKMFPIEMKDIRQIPKEKVIAAKIGSESDSYVMYAIKSRRIDILKFLLRDVPEIDLLRKNSQGMTALHLAIRSDSCQMVKLLFLRDHSDEAEVTKVLENARMIDESAQKVQGS